MKEMLRILFILSHLFFLQQSSSMSITPRIAAISLTLFCQFPALLFAKETPDALAVAMTPVPRADAWWTERHTAKLAERDTLVASDESTRVIFVGDSITHSWENAGKGLWAEQFAPRGAFNIGYSGDRTEHVLWRLGVGEAGEANNEIAGLAPDLFVVMIGTNNTGHRQDPPEATAAGVEAIVDRLQEASPESHVLLLAIFPRGATADDPLRQLNTAINEKIASLGERESVTFLDIKDVFLEDDGTLPESVMPDLLHPQKAGYHLWADAIEPHVARFLGE